jgi:penicillin amidase
MDLVRRVVRGRLSEILGPDLVEVDKLFLTISAGKSIDEITSHHPHEVTSALKAYAAGVNHFIEHHKGPLPIEFTILGYRPEPWKFSDGISTHYYMAWDLNSAFDIEMLHAAVIDKVGEALAKDLFPDYPRDYPTIIPRKSAGLDFIKSLAYAREVLGAEGMKPIW